MIKISKEFTFNSAHQLKWRNEHTYKLIVSVWGELAEDGIVMDYGDLEFTVNNLILKKVDHKYLNDLFDNPTAELMVIKFYEVIKIEMQKYFSNIKKIGIELKETPTSSAYYEQNIY